MGKWEKVRLGDVASYVNGFAFKPEDWSIQGLPIIRIQNLTESRNEVNYYAKSDKNKYEINDGDVLISWSASLGVYEWSKGRALLNQHIFKVVFDKLEINKKYFIHVITHLLKDMSKETHGSTMKHITKSRFDNMQIPLPPLEIQQKIAATLDTAAALLKFRKQQLAELEVLIQSVFYEMFGDPVRNEKGWEARYLKDLYLNGNSAIKCGPFGSALKKDEFSSVGVAVWNMDNINKKYQFVKAVNLRIPEEKFKVLTAYNVENGDIIISRAGTVGKMCVVNSEENKSIISTNLIRLRLNNKLLLPIYFVSLMHYWGTRVAQLKKGEEGTFTHMNTGVLDSIYFPLPPLSLQTQFAAIVQKIDQQKALVQQSIDETQILFDSLMSQYFD